MLVTEGTIEENLLGTLSAKHDLALAALDADSEVTQVDFASGVEELRRRLEVLLGAQPEAPVDVTPPGAGRPPDASSSASIATGWPRRAGELLGAVFHFLGELVAKVRRARLPEKLVGQVRQRLTECVEEDPSGRPRLTLTLPDRRSLDTLAQTLSRLLVADRTGSLTEN